MKIVKYESKKDIYPLNNTINMDRKQINSAALIINLTIIVLEVIGFALAINELGIDTIIYYTEDSNFLILIASILFSYYLIKQKEPPKWLSILKYIATVSVTITFLVVIFILSWMSHFSFIELLTEGSMLYHHTLCPILAILSFTMLEKYSFTKKDTIRALYFTVIYAAIMIPMNILKVVDGPYPFLKVNSQPIPVSLMWIVIIFGFAFLIALILKKVNEKVII